MTTHVGAAAVDDEVSFVVGLVCLEGFGGGGGGGGGGPHHPATPPHPQGHRPPGGRHQPLLIIGVVINHEC